MFHRNRCIFSSLNCLDVARRSAPHERLTVGAIRDRALEVLRVEGRSPGYMCSQDESGLCIDEEVEIHSMQLDRSKRYPEREMKEAMSLSKAPLGPEIGGAAAASGIRCCCRLRGIPVPRGAHSSRHPAHLQGGLLAW